MSTVRRLLPRVTGAQIKWLGSALRNETTGGILLLAAAVLALIWANVNFEGYSQIRDFKLGPDQFHLDLTLGQWAADGLLAIFFFVAGIELKHELQVGSLKDRSVAAVPIAAAIGGMVIPALIFAAFNQGRPTAIGWGIPMATDIAFALAVLAVAGRRLPIELRAFLLTLAVVDDLGAIIVIAIFYTAELNLVALALAIAGLVIFGLMQKRGVAGWYFYLPLALVIWFLMHESGVHATIAGVAMGLLMDLKRTDSVLKIAHPVSAGLAVPVFAFFASGVFFVESNLLETISSPLALGIITGLVIGKPVGIFGTAWLMSKFTRASLSSGLSWWDVATIGSLAGVGFTVALLINELAMPNHETASVGTLAVLLASSLAAIIASLALQIRKRAYAV